MDHISLIIISVGNQWHGMRWWRTQQSNQSALLFLYLYININLLSSLYAMLLGRILLQEFHMWEVSSRRTRVVRVYLHNSEMLSSCTWKGRPYSFDSTCEINLSLSHTDIVQLIHSLEHNMLNCWIPFYIVSINFWVAVWRLAMR